MSRDRVKGRGNCIPYMLADRVACAFMTCGRHGGATSEFPVDASVVREMLIHINAVSRNETYHDEVTRDYRMVGGD